MDPAAALPALLATARAAWVFGSRVRGDARPDSDLDVRLEAMTSFRNLAVHRDGDTDLAVVETILRERLDELLAFAALVLRLDAEPPGDA